MARIRSIHPGIWTDEAFVSVSPLARLLFMGLWNEADDQGVFEWKPVTLKMRILAADSADVPALLAELVQCGMIRRFDVAEKAYGAIRNFRRFQRPEKPKAYHPLPDEIADFVALSTNNHTCSKKPQAPLGEQGGVDRQSVTNSTAIDHQPVAYQSPTATRSEGRMEEEGGKRKEEKNSSLRSERGEAAPAGQAEEVCEEPGQPLDARTALFREGKARLMRISGKTDRAAGGLIQRWLRETGDDCAMISGLLAMAEADRRYDPIAWVEAAILKRTGKRDQPPERRSNRAWAIDVMLGRSQPPEPDEARFVPAEELRH